LYIPRGQNDFYGLKKGSDMNFQPLKNGSSPVELGEQVGNALEELFSLLEAYAPAWYTSELHEKAETALLTLER
jgi:hypothetical protein